MKDEEIKEEIREKLFGPRFLITLLVLIEIIRFIYWLYQHLNWV